MMRPLDVSQLAMTKSTHPLMVLDALVYRYRLQCCPTDVVYQPARLSARQGEADVPPLHVRRLDARLYNHLLAVVCVPLLFKRICFSFRGFGAWDPERNRHREDLGV
jgi:hypothetical protein